jgi:hypothetical protein
MATGRVRSSPTISPNWSGVNWRLAASKSARRHRSGGWAESGERLLISGVFLVAHPLESARLKLDRAREHIEAIDSAGLVYQGQNPYGMRSEVEPVTHDKIYRLEVKVPLPTRLGLIAGEAAAAERSALNYLVNQLVIRSGAKPVHANQFPIFVDPAKYKLERDRYLAGIRESLKVRIDDLQPRHGEDRHPLVLLQWMNNVDKHTDLHPSYIIPLNHDVLARLTFPAPGSTFEVRWPIPGSPVDDGAVLYRVRTRPSVGTSDVTMQGTLELLVAFGEALVTMPELREIESHVRGILDGFEDAFV